MQTTRISSKGQIVLPSSIRAAKAWRPGQTLAVVSTEDGVLLKPVKAFGASRIEDVAGCLRYKGPAKSVAEMRDAVDAEAKRRRK
ncbi:MAG TPA: AbrB/MazE/SpoVT family DNA-binding domain-containing protein [Usitatibacter sp.]|nr:AbrB/MazE/SpoVT family DNA-binding domain-containing protein [Usitatibacter sp.]